VPANGLASWDGVSWTGVDNPVAAYGDDIYLRSSLGVFAFQNGAWARINAPDGLSYFLQQQMAANPSGLYIGGSFTSYAGIAANRIVRYFQGLWMPLGAGVNGSVTMFYPAPNGMYVGGTFDRAGGILSRNWALWEDGLSRCLSGVNADSGIDGADVDWFLPRWEQGDYHADLNEDGSVDGADVQVFFEHWEAGC